MPDAEIARLASQQYGLVTYKQALAAGLTPRMARYRVATGVFVAVTPRVFRVNGAPITWHQQVLAACLHGGPGTVASHRTAAQLWNLAGAKGMVIDVSIQRGGPTRNPLAVVHNPRQLDRADCTLLHGIPVTRPARTLIDYATTVGGRLLEDALDDLLCRRLVGVASLKGRVEELRRRGTRGVVELHRLLAVWEPGDDPDSTREIQIVRRLVDRGIPRPVLQMKIYDGDRVVAEADAGWPGTDVALEFQSFRWHGVRRAFHRDTARRRVLVALGYRVVEATEDDMKDGCRRLANHVRRLLPEGGSQK